MMSADVVLEPLPTAFGTGPDKRPTVATPSCCCCCCCCLVTTTTFVTLTASEANLAAKENGANPVAAMVVAFLAIPFGIGAAALGPEGSIVPVFLFVIGACILGSLLTAKVETGAAVGYSVIVTLITAAAFVLEAIVALFTAFLIELLFPMGIWAGLAISRSRHRGRPSEPLGPHSLFRPDVPPPPPGPGRSGLAPPPPPPEGSDPDTGGDFPVIPPPADPPLDDPPESPAP